MGWRKCVAERSIMKRFGISVCVTMLAFFLSVALSFGWGGDVQIYSGQINTFDVDYDPVDPGSMFVAFQATGEDIIRLYSSTDHGTNWSEITTFNTDGFAGTILRSDLSRIRVIYNAGRGPVFWKFESSGRASPIFRRRGYLSCFTVRCHSFGDVFFC